jgi:ring-1,2-phenylacetyl-CoA epoxidase subunit PaaD
VVAGAHAPTRDRREAAVWSALAEIADPEIPAISVVDLGVIGNVAFAATPGGGERLSVELLPTFIGCPAIEIMRQQIGERLQALELADEVAVEVSFAEPWTSDRISPAGREKLRTSGFAPPVHIGPSFAQDQLLTLLPVAECPYCGSRNTTLENPFGPTLCRAIYHCADCRQPFEQFKTV